MKKDYPQTLIVSLLITLSVFLLLLGAYIFFNTGSEGDNLFCDWDMLLAVATALMAAGVFGGAYLATRQLSEVCNGRHMEAANQIFAEMNTRNNVKARRLVYKSLPDQMPEKPWKVMKKFSKEERNAVKRVLNSLDHVAFLIESGWVPEELMMPWMHPMIAKSMQKLEWLVKYEQVLRNEPWYYENVLRLAERAKKWRAKHFKENEKIHWVKTRETI